MYCNFKNQAKLYLLIFNQMEIKPLTVRKEAFDLNIENQNTF